VALNEPVGPELSEQRGTHPHWGHVVMFSIARSSRCLSIVGSLGGGVCRISPWSSKDTDDPVAVDCSLVFLCLLGALTHGSREVLPP
jgi:hypothetical protein